MPPETAPEFLAQGEPRQNGATGRVRTVCSWASTKGHVANLLAKLDQPSRAAAAALAAS